MKPGLFVLVVAAALAVAGPAVAAPRVAVGPIEGDRSGDLADTLVEMLEGDYRVVQPRDVAKAIDRLSLEEDDVDNKKSLGKLAAELDVIGVIVGTVEPDGNKSKLTLMVYVAKSKSAFRMTARFSTPRQVRDSSLREDLRTTIGTDDDDRGGGRSLRDDDDRGRGRDRDRDDDRDRDRDRDDDDDDDRGRDRDRDDDDDDDRDRRRRRDDDDDDDDFDDEDSGVRDAHNAAVRLEVGVSGTGRNLSFNSNLPEDQAPPPYKSNLVPGARFHGELYPLAMQNPHSASAGLGVAIDFDRAIGLTTTSSLMPDAPLTTTSQMWSVGARYRYAFGRRATSPTVTLGVGYGKRKFTVDRAPLMGQVLDLPDVAYTYLDPSLALRIPLHPQAALSVNGRFLAMRDTGPIGKTDQYGRATVTGVDVEAGFEFVLGERVLVHISGLFTQIGYSFKGGGAQTNGRDGDEGDVDVGGARDRFVGAMGTVGVIY
jgi:hypothetical protein